MNNFWMMALWAAGGDFGLVATSVADQLIRIRMESEGKKAIFTESLPATIFTNSKGSRATTVVVNQGLVLMIEIGADLI